MYFILHHVIELILICLCEWFKAINFDVIIMYVLLSCDHNLLFVCTNVILCVVNITNS